eukprot:GHVO01059745.1.p1 GENE.GHVO01059745.1~~GHVO01059745.1.p1  ORF type:complete len:103 (+),score=2.91 GHVO01059745.1:418-726(+)
MMNHPVNEISCQIQHQKTHLIIFTLTYLILLSRYSIEENEEREEAVPELHLHNSVAIKTFQAAMTGGTRPLPFHSASTVRASLVRAARRVCDVCVKTARGGN